MLETIASLSNTHLALLFVLIFAGCCTRAAILFSFPFEDGMHGKRNQDRVWRHDFLRTLKSPKHHLCLACNQLDPLQSP